MYNINMYEYKDKPYSKIKKYEILPLNQNGFEKYVGSNSHNANYVSRINPKVFKEIVGMDYESIINEQYNQITEAQRNVIREREANNVFENKEGSLAGNEQDKTEEDNCINNQKTIMPSIHREKAIKPKLKTSQSMKDINPIFCMSPTLTARPNFYKSFHRKQTFKDKYGYEKKEFTKTNEDRYSLQLYHLKNIKLSNDDFNSTHSSEYYPTKKYCGFTSYCVPRTDEMNHSNSHSTVFNRIKMGLERSISSGGLNNCHEFDALKKENEDMKENLVYQTNKNFLLHTKLPNVLKIADTKKLIRKIGLGNSKDMGEKYNPLSNVYNTANRTKRNYTGSLFLH